MSNTKKFEPRPYFNTAVLEEIEREEEKERELQNPSKKGDQDSAGSDTRSSGDKATSDSEATYEKRWKDLKKHYDTEITKLRGELSDAKQKAEPKFAPPTTPEEIAKFKEKYPDFYNVMMTVAYEQMSASGDATGDRISHLEERLAMAEQEKAFAEIEKAHPDYVAVVNTKEFLDWLEVQDSAIQAWVKENSTNASTFIRALDLYKLDAGITKQMPKRKDAKADAETRTKKDTSAADDVSVSGNAVLVGDTEERIWTRDEIRQIISSGKFEEYEAELDKAMAEGRVR